MAVVHRTIYDLSTEILVEILRRLHYVQLIRCRRVCKSLRAIVDNTTSLQYAIEIGAAGYEQGESTGLTLEDLRAFRNMQRIYRNPARNRTRGVRIAIPKLSALGPHNWDDIWEKPRMFGDTLVIRLDDTRTLALLQLGSQIPIAHRLRTLSLGFDIADYFLDPSQNLLVACSTEEEIHFLTLEDGTVHSKVVGRPDGSTIIPTLRTISGDGTSLSISGDWMLFGLYVRAISHRQRYFLYHWPSGKLVKEWAPLKRDCRACLAVGHVFMPRMMLLPHTAVTIPIDIYRLPDVSLDVQDLVHVASYSFPDFVDETSTYLSVDSLPSSHRNSKSSPAMLTVQIGFKFHHTLVPISALLTEAVTSRSATDPPLDIPWQSWGPMNTRYVGDIRPCGFSGLHLICDDAILDFNPYDIKNDVYAPPVGRVLRNVGANPSGTVYDRPTEIRTHLCNLQEPLITQLPYRKTCRQLPTCVLGENLYCIEEEDGPKIVKVGLSDDEISLDVLVYPL